MILHPPPDLESLIERRLRFIFEHAFEEDARSGGQSYPPRHRQPDIQECLQALAEQPPRPDSLDLIERVVTGALDAVPEVPPGRTLGAGERAYRMFSHDLARSAPRLWQRLFDAGRFTPPVIEAALQHLPGVLRWLTDPEVGTRGPNWFLAALSPELQQSVIEVAEQTAEDAIDDLTPESAPVLIYLRSLRGPRFLVAAVRQHRGAPPGAAGVPGTHRGRRGVQRGAGPGPGARGGAGRPGGAGPPGGRAQVPPGAQPGDRAVCHPGRPPSPARRVGMGTRRGPGGGPGGPGRAGARPVQLQH